MKEIKNPKRPMIWYYAAVLAVLVIINAIFMPMLSMSTVKTVDYSTFLDKVQAKDIDRVEVQTNQIVFTLKSETNSSTVYRTGKIDDPQLVDRLSKAGAKFG